MVIEAPEIPVTRIYEEEKEEKEVTPAERAEKIRKEAEELKRELERRGVSVKLAKKPPKKKPSAYTVPTTEEWVKLWEERIEEYGPKARKAWKEIKPKLKEAEVETEKEFKKFLEKAEPKVKEAWSRLEPKLKDFGEKIKKEWETLEPKLQKKISGAWKKLKEVI